jgi:hypothetical protein
MGSALRLAVHRIMGSRTCACGSRAPKFVSFPSRGSHTLKFMSMFARKCKRDAWKRMSPLACERRTLNLVSCAGLKLVSPLACDSQILGFQPHFSCEIHYLKPSPCHVSVPLTDRALTPLVTWHQSNQKLYVIEQRSLSSSLILENLHIRILFESCLAGHKCHLQKVDHLVIESRSTRSSRAVFCPQYSVMLLAKTF